MRGKPTLATEESVIVRNIPAYAGKTLWWGFVVGFT